MTMDEEENSRIEWWRRRIEIKKKGESKEAVEIDRGAIGGGKREEIKKGKEYRP